ncbi:MAG: hypothetical protein AAB502_11940 [Chloroflexota bacterium]
MARETGLSLPIAFGVGEPQVSEFDPWWADDHHGHYIQPMEFLVVRGGVVFGSMYASGPVGRMSVDEVVAAIRSRERRRLEQ